MKWNCPNIHDLKAILDTVEIDKIIGNICDKRLSPLSDLQVVQLRDECEKLNISKKGKKVLYVRILC